MSDSTIFHVTILWEHELREAARAMSVMKALPETATEEDKENVGRLVLATCWTALRDLINNPDGNMTVMACRGPSAPGAPGSGGGK